MASDPSGPSHPSGPRDPSGPSDASGPSPPAGDAILVPGQGSQHDGMRAAVADTVPELLAAATALVGADPFEHLADGTRYTQPAIYCASVASWQLARNAVRPTAFAGHSFGEFAALAAAGAVDVFDGLELVVLRGRLTDEVATSVGGGMIAVLGLDVAAVRAIADQCALVVANDNCPGQTVLSGPEPALAAARSAVLARGAETRRLPVAGPFHSPLMAPAVPPFAAALAAVRFRQPAAPVYSGVTAAPFDDIPRRLAESLVSPVRWREIVELLGAAGVRRFVELAPGEVLSKMARRTVRGVPRVVAEAGALV